VGETKTLTATVLPEKATNKAVVWSSSKPEIASVSQSGVVTAITQGVAMITVSTVDGNFTDNCLVNVYSLSAVEELLTQENGWGMTAWLIDPPLKVENEYIYNFYDLIDDCHKDDITYFKKDKKQVKNYGSNLCPGQTGTEEVVGNWELADYGKSLLYNLFDTEERELAIIRTLDETTLKLSIFVSYEEVAKVFPQFQNVATGMERSNHEYKIVYAKVD